MHEKNRNKSPEEKAIINKKKGSYYNNMSEEEKEEFNKVLQQRSQNFWDGLQGKDREDFSKYRWDLRTDESKEEQIKRFIEGGKRYRESLTEEDIRLQVERMVRAHKEKFENNLLTITNRGNVVEAYFCDEKDFNKVPIAVCGYRLHFKIYATNLLKREVEVHFCTKKAIKDDFSNSFVWRNWKELEEKFNEEYFFDVKKGVINERGELLVEVDTTKLKKFAPISAIAIIKIINKDGNELGAYKDLDDTLKLYNDSILGRLPQNYSSVKVGYFEIKEVKRVQLEEEEGHSCPRCTAPVTVAQLRELFPKAEEDTLKTVADTYTKYMKELQMDTCWNKAHFFAQAAIETGFKLHIKSGEGFDYYWEDLIKNFGAFQTTEGRKKAKEWGRAERNSKINGKTNPKYQSVSLENKKKIANWAYSPSSKTGKELGNIYDNDGWTFRGKGLIQLTGRSAYQYANTYTKKENADIIANPDLVMTDIAIGVISSMAFFKWKKINILANGNRNTKSICEKVGKDVRTTDPNGNPSKNHAEKIIFFNNSSSKVFKIDECLWGYGKWCHPVKNPQLRGHYSVWAPERSIHSDNIPGRTAGKHDGIDLYAPEGTPVYACIDGEIYDPYFSSSYGNTVTVKGGYKGKIYYFFYAHLKDKVTLKAGTPVKAGDLIGYSGKTGSSAAALKANQVHLHFEVRTKGTRMGNRVDPFQIVSELNAETIKKPKESDQK